MTGLEYFMLSVIKKVRNKSTNPHVTCFRAVIEIVFIALHQTQLKMAYACFTTRIEVVIKATDNYIKLKNQFNPEDVYSRFSVLDRKQEERVCEFSSKGFSSASPSLMFLVMVCCLFSLCYTVTICYSYVKILFSYFVKFI